MSRNNKHIINVFGTLPRLHLNFCLHEGRGPFGPFTHLKNQQEEENATVKHCQTCLKEIVAVQEPHIYIIIYIVHVKNNLVFQFCSVTQSNDKIQVAIAWWLTLDTLQKHHYSSILPENCNFIWKHMGYVRYVEYTMVSTSINISSICLPSSLFVLSIFHQSSTYHPTCCIPGFQWSRHCQAWSMSSEKTWMPLEVRIDG